MITCEVCGGEHFEVHAGFMYCATCQTQSQDFHEQEHEFQGGFNVSRVKTRPPQSKKKNASIHDDGIWTSYEAFNHILYGMVQELKKYEVPSDLETTVLKLWACYLKECRIAFTSLHREKFPKLGLNFKHRDARVLYNLNASLSCSRRSRSKSKSVNSLLSNTSNSSISSQSRNFLARKRTKIIDVDYQEHLSTSMLSSSNLAYETLESLGRSAESDLSQGTSDGSESLGSFKEIFSRKDFKLYKNSCKSPGQMQNIKEQAKRNVKCAAKNKLLSILHLALLMTGSNIQLSDLLRFIRECHLSYAKVSHFLPSDVKFSKNDFSYIDVISDGLMPTHLRQRKISSQLAYLLKIEKIPTPNMALLVERYCYDLNLPEQINRYSKKVLASWLPDTVIPKSKSLLPSYEAWAMVSIIFVMKLLFGLNDRTEMVLSDLAKKVNGVRKDSVNANLFVFEDWQEFVECRKTVLIDFHYPTKEQLNGDAIESSKSFLNTLMKESKDEHRNERFIPYSKYYIESTLIGGIKATLNALTKRQDIRSISFKPSLTPQTSYLETVFQKFSEEGNGTVADDSHEKASIPDNILGQKFQKCDVDFAFDPKSYLKLLEENGCELSNKYFSNLEPDSNQSDSVEGNSFSHDLSFDCSSKYWIFHYPNTESSRLANFSEEIFEKTPRNFQWMITECSRMIEMNVRDVYDELRRLEDRFGGSN